MSYRVHIIRRDPTIEGELPPDWPMDGPGMAFATVALASHAGEAEVIRLAELGYRVQYVILDPEGRWIEHPGSDSFV